MMAPGRPGHDAPTDERDHRPAGGGSTAADQPPGPSAFSPEAARRRRWTLFALAAITIAPVAASYAIYYLFPRESTTNYGALLPTASAPLLAGARADGTPFALADFRGRWVLLLVPGARCGADCERMLYATRQARTMQGREQERLQRVLVVEGPPEAAARGDVGTPAPDLIAARVDPDSIRALPGTPPAIYVVDPLGNLVLRYGGDPDIKALSRDLGRLLKASRIG
jgi:hypothetical protein